MAIDITALYCCLDDFCKAFEDWEAHQLIPSETTRQRQGKLSRSEMLFIMVLFPLSPYKHFKAFYLYGIGCQHRACFRDLPHYDRFVSLMPRLFGPLMVLLHSLGGEQSGVYFADFNQAWRLPKPPHQSSQGVRRPGRARQDINRVVFRPQAALRDQPQGPGHGAADHPRQHRRQHCAGRNNPTPDRQALRRQGLYQPRDVSQALATRPASHHRHSPQHAQSSDAAG